jgi:hypothetical protein
VGLRRTIVVHTRLAGHMARVEAARADENGVQILTMGQLAARLAGGLLRPIDSDDLKVAVREAVAHVKLGELEPIKELPGMVRAAVGTLDKIWNAGIDLSRQTHPRLQSLHSIEQEVLRRLPPSMKRPRDLVELARARIRFAHAVLGPIEVHGHSEMSPCWRPLLAALSETLPVAWVAGSRHVPDWIRATRAEIKAESARKAQPILYSCAHPQHEVIEAFRWMRALLASGTAHPEEIAIAAASPADFDDHVLALSRDCNIPVHFVHGTKSVAGRNGQLAAALADLLVKGLSQERVRRLFAMLPDKTPALGELPREWTRLLPPDAPLTALERWQQVFARTAASDWPGGIDRSQTVLDILRLLANGPTAAQKAGEKLLSGVALALWRRALEDGPPQALPVTLTRLRQDDSLEPASHVIFASAMALASAPRPYVRLLALNTGRWPRGISEDRLIPDHVIAIDQLDPLPIGEADRRDFATILAAAKAVTLSFSRRDVEGRLLGRSPLIAGMTREIYLGRASIPDHAASESDRLLARPGEFATMSAAVSALACWRDWQREEITPHDGFVGRTHPRLRKVFDSAMSATSLKMLLRDPIRFVWRYALGWKQPEDADEPLTVEPLAFGNLVHSVLRSAVEGLEDGDGFATAATVKIEQAIRHALHEIAEQWEGEQPIPPAVIWRNTLDRTVLISMAALRYPLKAMPAQKSWTEVPFGSQREVLRKNLPWDAAKAVEIPGTGIRIQGQIDRLDLAGNMQHARVIDYKTGQLKNNMADVILDGGGELQRCLYAFAVRTLVGQHVVVEAALLYPRAGEDEEALFPLPDVDGALARLANALGLARKNMIEGIVAPGMDAADRWNDFRFALPASPNYLERIAGRARDRLGAAADIWDAP